MAHIHTVYDTDNHFKVDAKTRKITDVSNSKTALVQGDHNCERFTFEIPRYIEGHDMLTCNEVQVHYLNVERSKQYQKAGIYVVEDLQESPESEDVVICSWLISGNATKYVGSLNFLLRFVCRTDEEIDYAWNTAIHSNIAVAEGIYNGEEIIAEYPDILEQWRKELMEEAANGTGTVMQVVAVGEYNDEGYIPEHRLNVAYADALAHLQSGGLVDFWFRETYFDGRIYVFRASVLGTDGNIIYVTHPNLGQNATYRWTAYSFKLPLV